jgi:hypothetical protein
LYKGHGTGMLVFGAIQPPRRSRHEALKPYEKADHGSQGSA